MEEHLQDDKNKMVLFLIAMLALVAFLLWASSVLSAPRDRCDTDELSGVTKAVTFLIHRQPHPLQDKPGPIADISIAICDAGARYEIDPLLLTAMAYRESTFRPDILSLKTKGKAGEKGLLQCGKECAGSCPHFLDTIDGQAMCGARWLRQAYADCGDGATDDQAVAMYADGRTCDKNKSEHLAWVVNRRVRLRDRLRNMNR